MLTTERGLEISELLRRIQESEDLTKIGSYFELISRKIEKKIDSTLNLSDLAEKIDKGEDLGEIGFVLQMLNTLSGGAAEKLSRLLDLETLSEKIEQEFDIGSMSYWLRRITEVADWLGDELIRKIDIEKIAEKIKRSDNLFGINFTLQQIAKTNKKTAVQLLTKIGAEHLAEKVNVGFSATGLWAVRSLINTINRVNGRMAGAIVEKLNQKAVANKIEEEATISETFFSLNELTGGREDLKQKVLQKIQLSNLAKKIDKSHDIWGIEKLFKKISRIDPQKGKKLFKKIDLPTLAGKLSQANLSVAKSCAETLIRIDRERGKKLIDIITKERKNGKTPKS